MGRKALEVGIPSRAASNYFERVRVERGLSQREMMRGVGMKAKSRFQNLLNGSAVWTLDDVEAFSIYLKLSTGLNFKEIEKEMEALTPQEDCSCSITEDSRAC